MIKIKQKLLLSSTIVTIIVSVFVLAFATYVSNNNLSRDLTFSKKLLNQLSEKYDNISHDFISAYTIEYLKIKTSNLLYTLEPLIKSNEYNQSKIIKDEKILSLLHTPLKINNIDVGYFGMLKGANDLIIAPPKIIQFFKSSYSKKFISLQKLNENAMKYGRAEGYYKYLNKAGKKIVNKYAVLLKIPNSDYIVAGLLNTDNYNLVSNKKLNNAVELFYASQEKKLISYYNNALFFKKIVFFISQIAIMIIFILVLNFTMGIMINPLRQLTKKLKICNPDNLDFSIDIPNYSCKEVKILAKTFTEQEKVLKTYIANFKKEVETRHLLEHELEIAKKIQNSVLPKISSEFLRPEFSIFAKLLSAKEVAGDFYDFFYLSKNKVAFLIADVSGKGIPAALFMQRAKIILRASCCMEVNSPGNALERTNHVLSKRNDACMFVTVFLIYYDIETGEISYSNAGHHPTVKLSGNKISDFGKLNDIALGTFENSKFKTGKTRILQNETLILYTDGITEAISPEYEEFGTSRLYKIIKDNKYKTIDDLGNAVLSKVNQFEEKNQFDDITILIFKRMQIGT